MKGETGYLLPYGCADALTAYKWFFEELLSFYQNIELSTVISHSAPNVILRVVVLRVLAVL